MVIGVPAIVGVSLRGRHRPRPQSSPASFSALRSFYFLPAITAIVAISLIWGYLYNSQFGLLNYLLGLAGLGPMPWLSDPFFARLSVALRGDLASHRASTSSSSSPHCRRSRREYREAAALDGAGAWRTTLSVVIPLLRFAILFVTVTTLIGWLQFFDEPFVLLKWPGRRDHRRPRSTSTSRRVPLQPVRLRVSAGSIVLLRLILAVTAIQLAAAARER